MDKLDVRLITCCERQDLHRMRRQLSDQVSSQQQAIRRYLAWRNGGRAIAVEPWRSSLRRNAPSACRAAA